MTSNRLKSIPALVSLLAAFALGNMVHAQAPASKTGEAAKSAAPANPADTLRPEVAKLLKAAQEAIVAKNFNDGLAKLTEVDAIASKTPYEIFVLERLRGPAAAAIKDNATAAKSFQFAYDSGRLTPEERTQFAEAITSSYYLMKDYKNAAVWARRALENGSLLPQTRMLLVQALILSDDNAAGAREINQLVADQEKAGRAPTQEMLRLMGTVALRNMDEAMYMRALERLVQLYATNDYWIDYIARVARQSHIAERYLADVFRLKLELGQSLTASQYMFMAQTSKQAGFPIDASRVLEQGFKAGVLSTDEHKKLRDQVAKEAADDIKNMARTSADAAKLKEGPGLFNSGLNYIYAGEAATGLPMMEEGIKRPGIRRPDDARLRMGIAYVIAGQRDKAVEVLGQVMSTEGAQDVAKLWTVLARQPATAASAPAPAAADKKPA